ncbi:MAG: cytidylate kinase-like family protein [Prevotella sp.]|nr:cytidylate kinase-like family protein [Prevotella sp.]
MNKNKQFVISINRELGSGGRTVGEKLAQKLGVSFYDKALIKALEEKYNLTAEEIEALKGRSHSWWADFKRVIGLGYSVSNNPDYKPSLINEPDLLTTDEMYRAECEILNGMAADESCIIAGRSGFYIFRNHPNHLSILIQASMEQRVQRLVRKRDITPEQAETIIKEVDSMRDNYITKYTGTNRYDARYYDLVINMDGKTEDQVVDLILQYIG